VGEVAGPPRARLAGNAESANFEARPMYDELSEMIWDVVKYIPQWLMWILLAGTFGICVYTQNIYWFMGVIFFAMMIAADVIARLYK
jgi:hypothetical protein